MRFIVRNSARNWTQRTNIRWAAREVPGLEVHCWAPSNLFLLSTASRARQAILSGFDGRLPWTGWWSSSSLVTQLLQDRIAERDILDDYWREQPVGTAVIVETGRTRPPLRCSCSHHAHPNEHCFGTDRRLSGNLGPRSLSVRHEIEPPNDKSKRSLVLHLGGHRRCLQALKSAFR